MAVWDCVCYTCTRFTLIVEFCSLAVCDYAV